MSATFLSYPRERAKEVLQKSIEKFFLKVHSIVIPQNSPWYGNIVLRKWLIQSLCSCKLSNHDVRGIEWPRFCLIYCELEGIWLNIGKDVQILVQKRRKQEIWKSRKGCTTDRKKKNRFDDVIILVWSGRPCVRRKLFSSI